MARPVVLETVMLVAPCAAFENVVLDPFVSGGCESSRLLPKLTHCWLAAPLQSRMLCNPDPAVLVPRRVTFDGITTMELIWNVPTPSRRTVFAPHALMAA
jgi:hypothetical protein